MRPKRVAAGRYRDTAEVVRAGVQLLQRAEAEVVEFVASLETARDEANRDGWVSLEEMFAEMDQIIRETADRSALSRTARFSQQARRELAQVLRSMDHPVAQQALRFALEAAARRLGEHPQYGRAAPAYVPEPYRFWSLPRFGYVLVYDPQTEPIEILRFVHDSRDLPQALAELRRPASDADPV